MRVKVLVEAEEGPRRLEAVARHLQLALRVHILDEELRRKNYIIGFATQDFSELLIRSVGHLGC